MQMGGELRLGLVIGMASFLSIVAPADHHRPIHWKALTTQAQNFTKLRKISFCGDFLPAVRISLYSRGTALVTAETASCIGVVRSR